MASHVHDTATLRDALDAASFFASSMGRVGADFQSLLGPIFEPRLVDMIVGHWSDGLNGMMETLKACRDAGVAGPLFGTETSSSSSSGKEGSNGSNLDDTIEIQSSRTPPPPRKLLAFPPLARFLNAYLTGLNELRRCLLPGAFPAIRSAHSKLIADTKMALQANERAVLTPGLRGEAARLREVASKMKTEFDTCMEPYMNGCLEVAFGSVDYAMLEAQRARDLEEAKAAAIAAEKSRIAAEEEKARAKAEVEAKAKVAALKEEALERAEMESAAAVEEELKKQETDNVNADVVEEMEENSVESSTAPSKSKADCFDGD